MAKTLPVDDYTKMFGDKDLDEIIDDKEKACYSMEKSLQ